MRKDNPGFPFEYHFMDEQVAELFKAEMLTGQWRESSTALAIFISLSGTLWAGRRISASRRAKEIGIERCSGRRRKGWRLCSRRILLKWVLVACVLAFPLGWWLMEGWLRD